MTKEQFVKKINLIQSFQKEQEVLRILIDKLTDGGTIVEFGNELVWEIIDMIYEDMEIADAMDNDDLISWWLYENGDKIIYDRENGEKEIQIEVKTPELLYDYIVKFYR
jgi:hypothetical protein